MAKRISKTLYWRSQREVNHTTFVGLGVDCGIAVTLCTELGFDIDAVVFINNTHPAELFDGLDATTSIYNFYTKPELANNHIEGAEVNEYIRTLLPAHMSNRLAQEVYAQIVYDKYAQMYLEPNQPTFIYI
jgi:hypothetical protein